MHWLLVFVCGGAGALLRVGVALWLPARAFPWGTLCVNVLGCLLAGAVFEALRDDATLARAALLGGFCGGFTTFSAFGVETWQLLRHGETTLALGYGFGSLALGVAAVALGSAAARSLG